MFFNPLPSFVIPSLDFIDSVITMASAMAGIPFTKKAEQELAFEDKADKKDDAIQEVKEKA